jgi:hypothetical protein
VVLAGLFVLLELQRQASLQQLHPRQLWEATEPCRPAAYMFFAAFVAFAAAAFAAFAAFVAASSFFEPFVFAFLLMPSYLSLLFFCFLLFAFCFLLYR